ncbi:tripartite tricarboxylate transporter substrate binding protein [Xylophilus sp. GOD-11R]|uniref:Bug family tripartite tricarboxylate transporter substrate binding protein n=1 Tax=Xylophilus sp. GOD-11R TaxID=3089814 RepID=UPI00298D380E|nr:tripartite tricarboxylate transporter substrate binding protein [Xylophilus sp. GOD-11R]WPB57475.1 tripartite tricarboxylate transporter substrate binding protein [Xylophilus sp. GOD-11R]
MKKHFRIAATVALAALRFGPALAADPFPAKPVTVVVPFTPGGSSDTVMRALAPPMTKLLGQPVVLENKPGANGTVGAQWAARAAADGYTILIGSVGTWAITPTMLKLPNFDPQKDFEPLTVAVRTPNILTVTPSLPVNNVAELIAHLKKNPDKLGFASSGIGSTDHLTSVLFWQKTGTSGVHVAYKGGGAAISDTMAGHAEVLITNAGLLVQQIRSGKLKALAVTSAKRLPELPEVPTMAEAGVPDLEVYSWQGIGAPRGTSAEALGKLRSALVGALQDPTTTAYLEKAGYQVVASSPAEFTTLLANETRRWKGVIDAAGIKPE